MKLPFAESAEVPRSKIVEYLLSEMSEAGKSKARFLLRFGFTVSLWEVLAAALKEHAQRYEVASIEIDPDRGTRYRLDGRLPTPDGRNPEMCTVWQIDTNSETPRFITAYPGRRRNR